MPSISLEELHSYHAIDREVFSRLVISFMRNPAESLLVMATWLWLEDQGYPNLIEKMMNLSDPLVNALADEAARCLNCLQSNAPPMLLNGGIHIPLTAGIMEKDISLQVFYRNKFSAIGGIKNFLNTVCASIFTDILQFVLVGQTYVIPNQPLFIPGFPHPLFGSVTVVPRPMDYDLPTGGLWGWDATNNVSEDDRTMFLTFSRGFSVTEDEVKDLFTTICGCNCVDSVHMQENVSSNQQPLFARMVLNSITNVDQILNGRRIAKFRINNKHIWARKYERRE